MICVLENKLSDQAKTPDWVKDAIIYQIFPDRFAKSAQVVKPHNIEPWDTPPTTLGYKGGDLYGVVEHLDYLRDLGINTIYFNPIFQSASNHRYHTHDYFQVDPLLGGNAAFKALLEAAHSRGMRVILDGVFNHASRGFFQFNQTLENASASPYRDWFNFHDFPVRAYNGDPNYDAWWGLAALPKFNIENPQVREFIYGVAEYWVREGIDGWRLDVPGEIDDDEFWCEFRRRIKAVNPDAYIVGEIWQRGDRWLCGDQFDAVMNYQLTRLLLSFFANHGGIDHELAHESSYGEIRPMDTTEFTRALTDLLTWYPREITLAQMNLLDSHDTARFVTIAHGDTTALKLAFLLMFCYVGVPTIYYGDEIAMEGRKDPDCRRTMIWEPSKRGREMLAYTKKMTTLRNNHTALRYGNMTTVYAQSKTLVFARQYKDETMLVGINAAHEPITLDLRVDRILSDGKTLIEEWTREQIIVKDGFACSITIQPRDGTVWSTM
jgi:cyclomaltodextrinase / maltogenic alpha-amylase / neopullulanase